MRASRRSILAVAMITVVAMGAGWLVSAMSRRSNDRAEVTRRQVPWVLLEADPGGRSVTVLPLAPLKQCGEYGSATTKVTDKGIRIQVSIRKEPCTTLISDAMDGRPAPVAVPLPFEGQLGGGRIDGPGYQGVASLAQREQADQLRGAYPRRTYPGVEGLSLETARAVLKASGAPFYVIGPTDGFQVVGLQSPAPGTLVRPWRGGTRPNPPQRPLARAILVVIGAEAGGRDRAEITCAQAARLDPSARSRLGRLVVRCTR